MTLGRRVGAPSARRPAPIAFNQAASVLASPTRDHAAVSEALGSVKVAGATATGDALSAALRLFATQRVADKRRSPAAIVLLSDGTSVCGSDPLQVAAQARAAGVAVYTVGLGTDRPPLRRPIRRRSRGSPRAWRPRVHRRGCDPARQVYDRARLAERDRAPHTGGDCSSAGGALVLMALAAAASLRWF